jgi:hypothetical protein
MDTDTPAFTQPSACAPWCEFHCRFTRDPADSNAGHFAHRDRHLVPALVQAPGHIAAHTSDADESDRFSHRSWFPVGLG